MFNGLLVNNTGADIRGFETAIRKQVGINGQVPQELRDVFRVEMVKPAKLDDRDNGNIRRAVLYWAE